MIPHSSRATALTQKWLTALHKRVLVSLPLGDFSWDDSESDVSLEFASLFVNQRISVGLVVAVVVVCHVFVRFFFDPRHFRHGRSCKLVCQLVLCMIL